VRKTEAQGGAAPAPVAESRDRVTTEPDSEVHVPERITLEEMRALRDAGKHVILADVRTERSHSADNLRAEGAIRLPPDDAVRRARELGLDHHATLVLYCA